MRWRRLGVGSGLGEDGKFSGDGAFEAGGFGVDWGLGDNKLGGSELAGGELLSIWALKLPNVRSAGLSPQEAGREG
jgi:hypothetical protein